MKVPDVSVTVKIGDFMELVEAASAVPALRAQIEALTRKYDGLASMYSEILETVRDL